MTKRPDPHGKLRNRGLLCLVNPDVPSPAMVEWLGQCAFDAVFLDCEHQVASVEQVQDMARAAHYTGMIALVRPEVSHPAILTRYLDAGADGLIIPHVDTAAQASAAAEVIRDVRGPEDDRTYLFALVESPAALANVAEISAVTGVTGVMVGAVDLSQAMGFRGQPRHPEVRAAVERAIPIIHAAGKVAGLPKDSAALRDHRAGGACVVNVHARALLTAASAQHITDLEA